MAPTFLLSGGGTGGHIYPAIAIANQLRERYPGCHIRFVGAKGRMEMQKVPKAGYPIEGLWISGIQRRLSLKNLLFPLKLIHSMWRARHIVKKYRPQAVIGTGGFASAPLLRVASKRGIPCVIQEQNSYAGLANKWLAKHVRKICVAYEGMETFFPEEKLVFTGNPVRQDIQNLPEKREKALAHYGLDTNKKTVLVLGGSLGARTINQLVATQLPLFKEQGVQLLWQCGAYYHDTYKKYDGQPGVRVFDFLYEMDWAYAAADVVISRSGALSVSELCLAAKPVIFIPSSNVAENHQVKNAQAIVEKQAALMIEENALEAFPERFKTLINNANQQTELSKNIQQLAKPEATRDIVDQIAELMGDAFEV